MRLQITFTRHVHQVFKRNEKALSADLNLQNGDFVKKLTFARQYKGPIRTLFGGSANFLGLKYTCRKQHNDDDHDTFAFVYCFDNSRDYRIFTDFVQRAFDLVAAPCGDRIRGK